MTVPETRGPGLRPAAPRRTARREQAPVVAVVALGGGAGAAARYAASLTWPVPAGGFPWTTMWVNIAGCALIGVLMVAVTELRATHRLVRPFLGTGVLGGFTTFSTYAVDIEKLLDGDRVATSLAYLAATPAAALLAVWGAVTASRRVLKWRRS
ncbi:fluoride efflux transporter CrcB [Streptomyces sp. DH24]|uniref:fluoride efflux transporter CrcB n=1 Tax=Streptomyces sp. DH24 TaxID=3040123 RepID=UPI00244352F9|nr:fluoride efflux transporter CrcB [Streptomyces sp. DH24]MDG9719649.1 fluoride efflux transporter CrcB [Streptomyces sp. DH24]